jgi:hypothetical protein
MYMDKKVAKHPKRCKRRVAGRRPWKKSYVAIVLAANEENLFEIMETRQLFFRRYGYLDLYVVGLASNYENAVELLQQMLVKGYKENPSFSPRTCFDKKDFVAETG